MCRYARPGCGQTRAVSTEADIPDHWSDGPVDEEPGSLDGDEGLVRALRRVAPEQLGIWLG